MTLLTIKPAFLLFICAVGYALSALAMAEAAERPNPVIFVAIALCLGVAAASEIMILRQMDLAITYISIIGAESVLIVAMAGLIGEGLGPREMIGAGLVVVGAAVLGT